MSSIRSILQTNTAFWQITMAGKDDDRGEARKFPHTTSSRIENGVIPEMAKPVTSGKLSVVFHATGGDDDSQMMRQQPPQSSSPCAPSPQNISYHVGRLLVGCCVPTSSRSHQNPRPRRSLIIFFSTLNRRPKRRVNVLPTRSSPAASPIKLPPCRRHHRSVHCCVDPTSGGHPRPVLRPSLIFRWAPFRCPKQGNPQQRARTRARAGRLC